MKYRYTRCVPNLAFFLSFLFKEQRCFEQTQEQVAGMLKKKVLTNILTKYFECDFIECV